MSRITAINPGEATGGVKELLDFTNYFNETAKTEIDFPRSE